MDIIIIDGTHKYCVGNAKSLLPERIEAALEQGINLSMDVAKHNLTMEDLYKLEQESIESVL